MNTITSMAARVDRVVRAFRRARRAAALTRHLDAVHRAVAGIHANGARLRQGCSCGPDPIPAELRPPSTAPMPTTRRLGILND